jgi:hypothetical protein
MIDLDVNSMYAGTMTETKFFPKFFKSGNPTIVDGEQWYDVGVRDTEVAEWIRTNDKELWVDTTVPYPSFGSFDIHEKLYMMLELRFG